MSIKTIQTPTRAPPRAPILTNNIWPTARSCLGQSVRPGHVTEFAGAYVTDTLDDRLRERVGGHGDPELDFLGDVRGINAFQAIDRQPDGAIFVGLVMPDADPTLQCRFVIGKLAVFTERKNRFLGEPYHVLNVVNKINQPFLDDIALGFRRVHRPKLPFIGWPPIILNVSRK